MSDEQETLDASLIHLNEWFESLKRSGFTEPQALHLVAAQVIEVQRQATGKCPQCHPQ